MEPRVAMRLTATALFRLTLAAMLCGLAGTAVRAANAQALPDWVVTADGAHIVQLSAGLAWPRCVEGMRWNGRGCEGKPLRLTHAEALALAKTREKSSGVAWRLPHLKELQQLARQNTLAAEPSGPLLPGSPPGWCWTATANIDTSAVNEYSYGNVMRGVTGQNMARLQFLHAWAVDTDTEEARKDVLRRSPQWVRLVRPVD
jgi:hypothetical protein